jgi:hypothetical protein
MKLQSKVDYSQCGPGKYFWYSHPVFLFRFLFVGVVGCQSAVMAEACLSSMPRNTERIFPSHSPFLSKLDDKVGFLRRAAGESS